MLGKLSSFITNLFRQSGNPKGRAIVLFSCEEIASAEKRLRKMGCPNCDPMTSFEPLKIDDDFNSFTMCRTCGYVLVHDHTNQLIGSAGFMEPQHAIYLGNLAREEAKRNAAIVARERRAYRNRSEDYLLSAAAVNPQLYRNQLHGLEVDSMRWKDQNDVRDRKAA